MNLHLFGTLDLRTFGAFLPPGQKYPDGRPMRTALLLVQRANLAPLRAALEAEAVLGVAELEANDEALELVGFEFLLGKLRISVGKFAVLVCVVDGNHVPDTLNALARASAMALAVPVVEHRRIVLPGARS